MRLLDHCKLNRIDPEKMLIYFPVFVKVEGGMKHKGKTSQFNGLIGMLERSEIDVALSDLSLTFTRSQVYHCELGRWRRSNLCDTTGTTL